VTSDAPILGEPLPVELMNTIWADRDGVHDSLADAEGTQAWLQAIAPRIDLTGSDMEQAMSHSPQRARDAARSLRDALRRLAAAATDDDRKAATSVIADTATAIDLVNHAARNATNRPVLVVGGDGTWSRHTEPADDPVSATLAGIARQAIDLFTGPGRGDLRTCHAPGCVLYFVKQHPRREWCSAACGNRARVARHYRRHTHLGG
jgi:predicted RNA-binding Zn ribbon-like protein